MKLCYSTLGCPDWSLNDILANSKDLGFDGVEIRGIGNELYIPNIKVFSAENADATKEKLRRLGLTIPVFTSACYLHKDENSAQEGKAYIDTAKRMDVPYVRVLGDTSGAPGENVDVHIVKENLTVLDAYAKGSGVTLLLETNGIFADSGFMKAFLEENQFENVAVLWDIHHPFSYFGEAPEVTYGNLKPYIRHVHVKDSVMRDGKAEYCFLGKGDVPVKECLALLKQDGYDGFFSLEWLKRWQSKLEHGSVVFAQYKYYMDEMMKKL